MQIQEDLPVEIFNFYSATEFGMIAAECRAHEGLHVHADHCILEYVREDGRPALPGELGIAVLTNLSGFAMPLIRYRLGDVGALRPECCSCGSSFPLIEHPLGRQDDMVRLPSGKILSALGLGMIVRDFGEMIVHYRFIQESVDRIVLQLVLRKGHCADTLSSIRRQVLAFLEDSIHLDIRVVDFIPEEARKFRKFVSKLND